MKTTTNKTKRQKLKTRQCWNWPLKPIPSGNSPEFSRTELQEFIVWLIKDWPISWEECAIMAYIAEKTWREGQCCESVDDIFREILPKRVKRGSERYIGLRCNVGKAVIQLARRGLIECTPSRRRKNRFKIMNVALRDLLTKSMANAPVLQQLELW